MKSSVHYVDIASFDVGRRVDVLLREHPRFHCDPPQWFLTSPVKCVLKETPEGPVFETQNSIYSPYPFEEDVKSDEVALKEGINHEVTR